MTDLSSNAAYPNCGENMFVSATAPAVAVDASGNPTLRISDLMPGLIVADAHIADTPEVRAVYAKAAALANLNK